MKSRSFKSYVQIRESEDLSPSDMDINTEPDATKMFDGEEKESESGLHTLMQLLWTKHRQAIEPVIQHLLLGLPLQPAELLVLLLVGALSIIAA